MHNRILMGFSAFDILSAIMLFLSTWPIPAEASTMYASGNEATCTSQGFMLQLSVVPSVYNAIMAVYYLLVLRYGWTEAQLRRLQVIPPLWGFAVSLAVNQE